MDLQPNHHHHHHHLQQHPAPAPPPPSHKPLLDQDLKQELKRRPIVPLSFSNGALKKHRPLYPPPPPPPHAHDHVVYRECMKNHAASLGGHALDGCGEFMPSPDAIPADPASLTCAACGCHRNFHRRVLHGGGDLPHPHPHREVREAVDDGAAEEDDGDDEAVDDDEDEEARGSTPPPHAGAGAHQYYSAPHMLMALSAGIPGGPSPAGAGSTAGAATHPAGGSTPASAGGGLQLPRKRFRTKFSSLQKERMQELSERLGWRMQRRDEALVEECCREIGVSRGVFKVWMHNNKHNFVGGPSSRRAGGGGATGVLGLALGGNGNGNGNGNGGAGRGEATSSSGGGIGGGGGIGAGVNGVQQRNGVGEGQNGSGGVVGDGHGLNGSSPSS